jgi:toxin YoeB
MNNVIFTATALKEYMEWQMTDKKVTARINDLIKDILRNGLLRGIGKPELLRGRSSYSRRIDACHRLVYKGGENQNLLIISCKGHYEA